MRFRGYNAVSFAATLKALGVNIPRAAAFKKGTKKRDNPSVEVFYDFLANVQVVKDLIGNYSQLKSGLFQIFKVGQKKSAMITLQKVGVDLKL